MYQIGTTAESHSQQLLRSLFCICDVYRCLVFFKLVYSNQNVCRFAAAIACLWNVSLYSNNHTEDCTDLVVFLNPANLASVSLMLLTPMFLAYHKSHCSHSTDGNTVICYHRDAAKFGIVR